jgi:predicted phosphodiesterase
MTVVYTTNTPVDAKLEYGITEAYGQIGPQATHETFHDYPGTIHNIYKSRIGGLEPGKKYYYEVSGPGLTEYKNHFWTASDNMGDDLLVVAGGDYWIPHDSVINWVENKYGRRVDFVMHVGDHIIRSHMNRPWQGRIPIVLGRGNHDDQYARNRGQVKAFLDYPNYIDISNAGGYSFSFNYGPALFYVPPYVTYTSGYSTEQLETIENTLASSIRKWKFIFCHHIFFSVGAHADNDFGTSTTEGVLRREQAWPIFMKYGVQMAITGHDHDLQATYKIDGYGNQHPDGVICAVAGNSVTGKTIDAPWNAYYRGGYGPSIIRIYDNGTKGEYLIAPRSGRWNDGPLIVEYQAELSPKTTSTARMTSIKSNNDLVQVFPNPFNPGTYIRIKLEQRTRPKLAIYDLLGNRIRRLQPSTSDGKSFWVVWDGKDAKQVTVANGTYVIRIEAKDVLLQKRIILLR